MEEKKKSFCSYILELDQVGRVPNLKLRDGEKTFNSYIGVILSIVSLVGIILLTGH